MQDERRREGQEERVPLGQVLFDEIFLLFLLSLVISLALYNVWGLLDLMRTPVVSGP